MCPWSMVLAMGGLPTIQEGYEEDANQLNGPTSSSEGYTTEDYLQSICQLASPTFALPELHILTLRPPNPLKRNPSLNRVPRSAQVRDRAMKKNGHEVGTNMLSNASEPEISNVDSKQSPSATGPLEYIYRKDDVLLSISRDDQYLSKGGEPSGPEGVRGTCSSSSVPNLWSLQSGSLMEDLSSANFQQQPLTVQRQEPLKNKQSSLRFPGGTPANRREMFSAHVDKNSTMAHWTEGCSSAWKEARLQVCMLPAIAEI